MWNKCPEIVAVRRQLFVWPYSVWPHLDKSKRRQTLIFVRQWRERDDNWVKQLIGGNVHTAVPCEQLHIQNCN